MKYGLWSKIKIYHYPSFSKKSIHLLTSEASSSVVYQKNLSMRAQPSPAQPSPAQHGTAALGMFF